MSDDRNLNKLTTAIIEGSYSGAELRRVAEHGKAKLKNHSVTSQSAKLTTHFDGIEDVFVGLCRSHEVVVGAVAWLTNYTILSALSQPKHVAIVVQKEDFLRRDAGVVSYPQWRNRIHTLYSGLNPFNSCEFEETYPGQQELNPYYNAEAQFRLFNASGEYQFGGEAVRSMGYARDTRGHESPLMHHKFLVFGEKHEGLIMRPKCVVTGSFNLTRNAQRSRENVVMIEDTRVCQSFLSEWAQLWGMSEPLDWSSPEPSPSAIDIAT